MPIDCGCPFGATTPQIVSTPVSGQLVHGKTAREHYTGQVVAQPVAAVASAVLIPGQVSTGPLQLVGAVPVPIRDEAMPEAVILGPYGE